MPARWNTDMGCWPALLAALLLVALAGRADAQPVDADAPEQGGAPIHANADLARRKTEARERFARGLEFAKSERWDAALAEFLASREIYATRVATRNAALALSELQRFSAALELYTELLRDFGAQMAEAERREVEAELEELRRSVGELAIEGAPAGSVVTVDGEPRGTTPLAPVLVNAGIHTLRVSKPGHQSYAAEVVIAGRQRKTVLAELAPFKTAETSVARELPARKLEAKATSMRRLYVEISAGPALGASFGGTAESECDEDVEIPAELPNGGTGPACSSRARPFGFVGAARVGYRLHLRVGLELFGGYVQAAERLTRRVRAEVDPAMPEPAPFFADRYRDETRVSGPIAGVSASYGAGDRMRLRARVSLGVLRARVRFENSGEFSGALDGDVLTRDVTIPEQPSNLWVPFFGPEIRAGYAVSPRLTIDLGVAAWLLFPGSVRRAGRTAQSSDDERNSVIGDRNGTERFFSLPREESLGSFLLLTPTVAATLEL